MIWPRKPGVSLNGRSAAGAALFLAGALLFAVWLVPAVYGTAMSHLAVAAFRAQSSTQRVWDSARIRAYKQTLGMHFAAPEAVLRIPRLGVEVPVLEGTSDAILNRGVGHIPGTALPGAEGNLAVTGHRDGFFRPLKDIAPGDVIEVDRSTAPASPRTDRYIVRSTKVVAPSDLSVLRPTTGSTLTLITCFPFYYVGAAPQRFVVQADLLAAPQKVAAKATHSVPSI